MACRLSFDLELCLRFLSSRASVSLWFVLIPYCNSPMRNARQPELLAPAGDWEAMRAAVANGADAVYFGLSNFNARAAPPTSPPMNCRRSCSSSTRTT